MQWHKGSIMEAIAEAKAKNVVFLVFVSGEDEESHKMNSTLTAPLVTRCMEEMQYVAVTLQSNSEVCKQFSQIYPVVVVPCVYFIGEGGVPLEIVAGHLSPEEFLNKIEKVKQMQKNHSNNLKASPYSAASGSSAEPASSSQQEKIESNGVLPNDKPINQTENSIKENVPKTKVDTQKKKGPNEEDSLRQRKPEKKPIDTSITRLQFRFPDGSSVTHQFPSTTTLAAVRQYVQGLEREHLSNFILSTTFPRREFGESDYNLSLEDLQLTPCAAVLVIPTATTLSAHTPSIGIIWTLLAPITAFWNYLRNFIFGTSNSSTSSGQSRQEPARRNNTNKGSRFSRQDGNVHRIANADDDEDDDSNTWNGNSTQQM